MDVDGEMDYVPVLTTGMYVELTRSASLHRTDASRTKISCRKWYCYVKLYTAIIFQFLSIFNRVTQLITHS